MVTTSLEGGVCGVYLASSSYPADNLIRYFGIDPDRLKVRARSGVCYRFASVAASCLKDILGWWVSKMKAVVVDTVNFKVYWIIYIPASEYNIGLHCVFFLSSSSLYVSISAPTPPFREDVLRFCVSRWMCWRLAWWTLKESTGWVSDSVSVSDAVVFINNIPVIVVKSVRWCRNQEMHNCDKYTTVCVYV